VAAATLGGRIYAVGGNAGHERAFEAYDPDARGWLRLEPLRTPRRNAGVAVLGDRLFVVGGVETDGWTPVSTVESYDGVLDTWRVEPSLRVARTDLAVTACAGQLFALGGFNRGALSTVEALARGAGGWLERAALPTPRQFAAATCLDDRVYVAGGTRALPTADGFFVAGAPR
jgi:N-acetylneuraminic acid mutarotase